MATTPGPIVELLGQIAYHFSLIQPWLPTYTHLLISALFPIFAGSHASLSRPSSAAKPKRKKKPGRRAASEAPYRMEGLSPSDAILYPVMTGAMLAGLYFLIKWLNDPEIINKILNWYLSIFGTFSISRLISDSWTTIASFVFPSKYKYDMVVWRVNSRTRSVGIKHSDPAVIKTARPRGSPLPGVWSRLPLPSYVDRGLWYLREFPQRALLDFDIYLHDVLEGTGSITPQLVISFSAAVCAVLYFNLVARPWWLTNLLGFSFSYTALQIMSPTTFWTGTLVLTSLFFYDIYFVFFTPMMITVATKLDIPVKLLFPRPDEEVEGAIVKKLAMLGLGDIVLPGLMIGLALRFDLYMFYLKKQNQKASTEGQKKDSESPDSAKPPSSLTLPLIYDSNGLGRAEYRPAAGGWGERFWLGKSELALEGGYFPKPYFYASIVGYVIGMLCTLGVMHVCKHGQPALLYLVPGVLISLWGTAAIREEIGKMWEYSENIEEEEAEKKKKMEAIKVKRKAEGEKNDASQTKDDVSSEKPATEDKSKEATTPSTPTKVPSAPTSATADKSTSTETPLRTLSKRPTEKPKPFRLISFTLSLPASSSRKCETRLHLSKPLEREVQVVGSPKAVKVFETDGSSVSSTNGTEEEESSEGAKGKRVGKKSVDLVEGDGEGPPEKRRRVE